MTLFPYLILVYERYVKGLEPLEAEPHPDHHTRLNPAQLSLTFPLYTYEQYNNYLPGAEQKLCSNCRVYCFNLVYFSSRFVQQLFLNLAKRKNKEFLLLLRSIKISRKKCFILFSSEKKMVEQIDIYLLCSKGSRKKKFFS